VQHLGLPIWIGALTERCGLLNAHHDHFGIRVGLGEHIAQRD
jgi:hypothetical protein